VHGKARTNAERYRGKMEWKVSISSGEQDKIKD
jgi:hypothetical protein